MSAPPPSVESWAAILAALGDAGAVAAGIEGGAPAIDVAEGFQYVLNVLSDQFERATMPPSAHPQFLPAVTPVRKLLFDNPDTDYDIAPIRGDRTYRITGRRGTSTYLAFCVYSGTPTAGRRTRTTNLADADMEFGRDGSFEVVLSATEMPGNWIRLEPDAHAVFARQYFLDHACEQRAQYTIATVDPAPPDTSLDDACFARIARSTAQFLRLATKVAHDRVVAGSRRPNVFVETRGHGVYGTPDASYVVCWYELADDEALVVDVHPPAGRYWGVHLANRWGQSLDWRSHGTVLNAHTATVVDGDCRVVVAATDPGVPNWLDTAGHPQGWVLFRWLLAADVAVPSAAVVGGATLGRAASRSDRA